MDKLKWAIAICAILALVGLAVVSVTGQQGLNRDSFFVAIFWIVDHRPRIVASYTNSAFESGTVQNGPPPKLK